MLDVKVRLPYNICPHSRDKIFFGHKYQWALVIIVVLLHYVTVMKQGHLNGLMKSPHPVLTGNVGCGTDNPSRTGHLVAPSALLGI